MGRAKTGMDSQAFLSLIEVCWAVASDSSSVSPALARWPLTVASDSLGVPLAEGGVVPWSRSAIYWISEPSEGVVGPGCPAG